MKIGIFGSKMDPPHVGHLVVAERARSIAKLDFVYLVPAGQPVDKASGVLDKELRFEMTEAAASTNQHFKASRLEIDREGPSYSIDTVLALRQLHGPEHEYFLIVGQDRAPTVANWHRADELIKLVALLVAPRPNTVKEELKLDTVLPKGATFEFMKGSVHDISSTFLREEIAAGRSVRYLVPDPVLTVIEKHGCYKNLVATASK